MNEIPALIDEANAIAADAERGFARLTRDELNWKPGADKWSVAQCFEHLIKINSAYFPQWRRIEQGAYTPTWRDRVPLLARFFGSIVLRAVQPASRRKFKAAKHVEPSPSAIDADIIARFTAHQQEVIQHMKIAGSRDATAIMVTSPVAPIAFYSLLDAFRILVAHERRHMAQAERVVRAHGFPSRS
jgi:hypothetical protein